MKKIVLVCLVMIFSIPVSWSQATQKTKKVTVTIKTKVYCDHCQECESCKARIEHELNFTKGVKYCKMNVDKQEINVTYDPSKTSIDKIRTAINNAGYDADEQKAPEKAVSKLDDCCRKSG